MRPAALGGLDYGPHESGAHARRAPAGSVLLTVKITVRIGVGLAVLLALATLVFWSAGRDPFVEPERPRTIRGPERARRAIAAERAEQVAAADRLGLRTTRQILFGDLHVHTTFSLDAFWMSLPMVGGEGSHPPADACDFARYCSALDFWSITDHDFSLTPTRWRETIDSIRQCNAVASDPKNPDTVAFLGWEWTQVGLTPEDHYGHKNVILKSTADDEIPTRPIAASDSRLSGAGATPSADGPVCDPNANVRDLPPDCLESAPTPAILFRKLREWGFASLVIPHGTTWGFYTPPGSSWDKQLAGDMHDPQRQRLIEVYSGRGDSEVYRDWREVELGPDGSLTCLAPRPDYLPTCWRAGEIIRSRCLTAGENGDECETRAVEARAHAIAARVASHRSVPGARPEEWLDAGQCRDCREPAFAIATRSGPRSSGARSTARPARASCSGSIC